MCRQHGQMPPDTMPKARLQRLLLLLPTMIVVSVGTAAAAERHEYDVRTAAHTAHRVVAEYQMTSQRIQQARSSDVTIGRRGVRRSGDLIAVLHVDGIYNKPTKENLTASQTTSVDTHGTVSSSGGDGREWRKQHQNATLMKQMHKFQRFKTSSIMRGRRRRDTAEHCESGWRRRHQSCYKLTTRLSWSAALGVCQSMNAFLTHIDSFNKEQDVYAIFQEISVGWSAWIGLKLSSVGQWIWQSGQPLTYVNWRNGEPNNWSGIEECVELLGQSRDGFNDRECNFPLPGICEKRIAGPVGIVSTTLPSRAVASISAQDQRAKVRLVEAVNGHEHSGIVEVNYRGEWGIVCDDEWDIDDARVICRQLGYGDAMNAAQNLIATSNNFFLDDVKCDGNEQSIDQCVHSPWKEHDCENEEAAGVICQPARDLVAEDQRAKVRLVEAVNGHEHSGIVEVNYGGEWGIVCDDEWDIDDARVICRQLGYGNAVDALTQLNSKSWQFFLDDVDCNGTEKSIEQCAHSPWKKHDCGKREAAGVICQVGRDICHSGSWGMNGEWCFELQENPLDLEKQKEQTTCHSGGRFAITVFEEDDEA